MIQYRIENNIPEPKYAKKKTGNTYNYPIARLEKGQSFLVTDEDYNRRNASRVRGRVNLMKKDLNLDNRTAFSVGKDESTGKIRVWRL